MIYIIIFFITKEALNSLNSSPNTTYQVGSRVSKDHNFSYLLLQNKLPKIFNGLKNSVIIIFYYFWIKNVDRTCWRKLIFPYSFQGISWGKLNSWVTQLITFCSLHVAFPSGFSKTLILGSIQIGASQYLNFIPGAQGSKRKNASTSPLQT